MSAPDDFKYPTALLKKDLSSFSSSSLPNGRVSTRNRAIRTIDLRTIVYGKMQRNLPQSSIPPSHPYSSLTAHRNCSDANTGSPECQLMAICTALINDEPTGLGRATL